jgi:two-component system response regulator GlrR
MSARNSDSPEFTDSVTIAAEVPRRINVREWALEVVSGPDKGKKVATLEGLLRVGTDPSSDLVLSDGTVSRRHLEVERTPRGLLLRDLGSRNGSWVDGRQVAGAYVEPGDKIALGKTKLAIKQQSRGTEIEVLGGESFGELVGASDAMRLVFTELRRVSMDDQNLLIEGETGTGKELAARAVHAHSLRRHGPFKVVDCALVSEANAATELFGPEGAFTGAQNGTLFFDEITELPTSVQPKLLRALETRELPALPGGKPKPFNARTICATHENLGEEVARDRFRKDLFFRIAVARVRLPPLRTRKSDLPLLATHLLKTLGASVELSAQTQSLLEGYDWPGNVRELRNVLERGALMQQGSGSWLELMVDPSAKKGGSKTLDQMVAALPYHDAKDRIQTDFERHYFAQVMKECGFDIKLAETRTGLSMQSLYRLLKKSGLRLKDLKNADGLE